SVLFFVTKKKEPKKSSAPVIARGTAHAKCFAAKMIPLRISYNIFATLRIWGLKPLTIKGAVPTHHTNY
ncbi:MAG: hypothetical protein QF809_03910, partial [Candidatus Peribacteraceae bacterium]|nr:hypothetical protein [Candidatus Peribacteraceae bacterium]